MKLFLLVIVFSSVYNEEVFAFRPGDCDFDTDLCNWEDYGNNGMNWTRHTGETPTRGTGPTADHTSGSGYYVYIEASNGQNGDYALLTSETLNYTTHMCLTFWYHMYVADGSLLVMIVYNQTDNKTIWEESGKHSSQQWLQGRIKIPYLNDSFKVAFEGIKKGANRGDIALDDVVFADNDDCTENFTISATSDLPSTLKDTITVTNPETTTVQDTTMATIPETTTVEDTTTVIIPETTTVEDTTTITIPETTTVEDTTTVTISDTATVDDTTTVKISETTTVEDTTTVTIPETTTVEDTTTAKNPATSFKVTTGFCPTDSFDGVVWSPTAHGEKDTRPCPSEYTGIITRRCSTIGEWEPPVYIGCVDKKLQETTNKFERLENITDPAEASAEISGILELVDNTTSSEDHDQVPLKSGDLIKTTEILSSVIKLGNSKNASVNTEKVVNVLNSVLNSGNSQSWTEVNQQGKEDEGAVSIMKIVENLGNLVTKNFTANETKFINKTNIVIEISAFKANLSFPQDSKSNFQLPSQTAIAGKFYTAAIYKTISSILPTSGNSSVGSDVLAVSFSNTIPHLEENITLTFEQNQNVNFTDPQVSCGYWNFTAKTWSYAGCYLKADNTNLSICSCNHLTNFAILMSPSDVELSELDKKILEIIGFVGCGLSILSCLLTLVIYAVFWRYVKNDWAVILMNICIVLIIGYSVFLTATEHTENEIICITITAVLHYVFLVVFFLMLAEGISMAISVTVVFKTKSKLPIYLTLAWLLPLVIVGATLGITQTNGYHSKRYCWLNVDNFIFMAFVGPVLLIILVNIVTIILVFRAKYSSMAMANQKLKQKAKAGVKDMATLLPVLGLSWFFGILAFNENTIIFQYLFGITTSCQGLFIFIFHTALNKKVHEGFRKTMERRKQTSSSNFTGKPKSSSSHAKLVSKVSSGTDTTQPSQARSGTDRYSSNSLSDIPYSREMIRMSEHDRQGDIENYRNRNYR